MNKPRIIVLAAILSAAISAPALADWDNVGSIKVDYNIDRDSKSPDFGGSVERLQFVARGGDVQCRFIRVTFGNGQTVQLYSGRLQQGVPNPANLPGTSRNVKRLEFMCRAFSKAGATIQIQADIGRYRDEWRKGPQWNYWSHVFTNWTAATGTVIDNTTSVWVPIGNVTFDGPNDRDNTSGGFAGRSITALGFKAMNGSAVCARTTIRFGNGNTTVAMVNGGRPLNAGQFYQVGLPGNQRNVTNVVMRCRALGQRSVTISIMGNK
ncbi:MAG TPA: hypothetical protein VHW02_01630 [Rhizomicrobium sp.]|jgi:hypothetical protein|nr:hypothetical protein [Rhizomicrobium sp.]